jgi:hypothetical protein
VPTKYFESLIVTTFTALVLAPSAELPISLGPIWYITVYFKTVIHLEPAANLLSPSGEVCGSVYDY